jgi:hypothetical protein
MLPKEVRTMTLKMISVSSHVFLDLEIAEMIHSQGSRIERRARNADVTPTTQICQYNRSERFVTAKLSIATEFMLRLDRFKLSRWSKTRTP